MRPGGLVLFVLIGLTGCASVGAVRPPVCVTGPRPTLNELVRCQQENCTVLRVLRGEDWNICLIREE